ncbi:hypothetical protein OG798_54740 [Streptomyces sp. NBC_00271]|nr:hypothetical protein [Streptomyces sp. NBC_00271]
MTQYRMAVPEQLHWMIASGMHIERPADDWPGCGKKIWSNRITLLQAGRIRVWFPTQYDVQLVAEWPEIRGRRPLTGGCPIRPPYASRPLTRWP